ncbi:MAG: RNA-binding protein [Bacilli bacterium]|nr:RNA-binding protein [Bacilli bacterium]
MAEFSVWSNYLNKAKQGMVLTKFLDEVELSELINTIKYDYEYQVYGGYDNAERVRVIINPYMDVNDNDFELSALKIEYPNKFVKINHRNVLGTIMSLGINRNTIGDIIITDDEVPLIYVILLSDMVEYLKQNLLSINNHPVKILEVDLDELKNLKTKEAINKSFIIASLRLDVVLASVLNVSRNEINSYFEEKKILVNHQICMNKHYEVSSDDLISVRKFGRIKLNNEIKKTKKNNLVINVNIWR